MLSPGCHCPQISQIYQSSSFLNSGLLGFSGSFITWAAAAAAAAQNHNDDKDGVEGEELGELVSVVEQLMPALSRSPLRSGCWGGFVCFDP